MNIKEFIKVFKTLKRNGLTNEEFHALKGSVHRFVENNMDVIIQLLECVVPALKNVKNAVEYRSELLTSIIIGEDLDNNNNDEEDPETGFVIVSEPEPEMDTYAEFFTRLVEFEKICV